jgi:hypothetical protein
MWRGIWLAILIGLIAAVLLAWSSVVDLWMQTVSRLYPGPVEGYALELFIPGVIAAVLGIALLFGTPVKFLRLPPPVTGIQTLRSLMLQVAAAVAVFLGIAAVVAGGLYARAA